ncbi:probable 3-deoxy-D-manno-octulosonic acid transferase, mitochondrial [Selaginella moellendorffii]|uniref:probable 3-deoxy-D-manno-octulosonic acid transferase, mitochondrial n=1 Tax=Selaginella moellendorffii TaxID=88036 RepID=UPI000D1C237D|nr:probable 3-deoxy-D-manno-octulosonic acid transferase, mitochondrial [Selaginella moellendorffii]|eukprot:XP_024537135.1 probable 3-deoxy-D-manno-octulosonic acid transferase, mitochondrial [Selaginella moellendorffii]
MERALYTSISAALEPLVMAHLFSRKCRGLEHPTRWKERLGYPSLPRPSGTLIWFHAVSLAYYWDFDSIVSNSKYISRFIQCVRLLFRSNVLRSKLSHGVIFQFVPVDTPAAVDRFLSHWKPQAGIFMESELWPNLLLSSSSRKIPMALLNARVSEKSFTRWSCFTSKSLVGEMLGSFSLICPLSTNDAVHLQLLGASPGVIHFSGNSKYAWGASQDKSQMEDLLLMKRKVWLASSTHAGEEEVIAEVHLTLKRTFPEILTILAPRQPSRAESIMMVLRSHGLKVAQRSINENICLNTDIYLADTVGELTRLYNSVPIAVVGGSLLKGLAGHNMAEAAACGCAVLTGTHLGHFSKMLKEMQSISPLSILQVSSADLASALMELFSDEGVLRLRRKAAKAASTTAAAGIIDNIFKLLELTIFQGIAMGGEVPAATHDGECSKDGSSSCWKKDDDSQGPEEDEDLRLGRGTDHVQEVPGYCQAQGLAGDVAGPCP